MDSVESKNVYIVEITETLQRQIAIEAESESEAIILAKKRYDDGLVVLNESNLIDTEFEIYNYNDPMEVEEQVKQLEYEDYITEELYENILTTTKISTSIIGFNKKKGDTL